MKDERVIDYNSFICELEEFDHNNLRLPLPSHPKFVRFPPKPTIILGINSPRDSNPTKLATLLLYRKIKGFRTRTMKRKEKKKFILSIE